jgi:hypothetical protein
MKKEKRRYLAFMLRLWQVRTNGEAIWRGSLESPHTGERLGFANPEALFKYLEEQIHRPDIDTILASKIDIDISDEI